jgi:hypothetical protein
MVQKQKYTVYVGSLFKEQTRINSKSAIYTKRDMVNHCLPWTTAANSALASILLYERKSACYTVPALIHSNQKPSLFGGDKLEYLYSLHTIQYLVL